MVVNMIGNFGSIATVEVLFLFLLAVGVTGVTVIGFAAWALFHVVRAAAMLLSRVLLGPAAKKPAALPPAHAVCPDPVCRGVNPEVARFCRRCGRMLRGPARPS